MKSTWEELIAQYPYSWLLCPKLLTSGYNWASFDHEVNWSVIQYESRPRIRGWAKEVRMFPRCVFLPSCFSSVLPSFHPSVSSSLPSSFPSFFPPCFSSFLDLFNSSSIATWFLPVLSSLSLENQRHQSYLTPEPRPTSDNLWPWPVIVNPTLHLVHHLKNRDGKDIYLFSRIL